MVAPRIDFLVSDNTRTTNDQLLFEALDKKYKEITKCKMKKIFKAQDAITVVN